MSATGSPARETKFIPQTPPPISQSLESTQEHLHLSKKPRNYKYWSDDEVKKILCWLNLPENEGKLARNKAQACREVAKKLFDGDEYMAISVRSKLMSLEKGFREAEQLRLQLNSSNNDEALINDKMKEVGKFHKECKQLFGKADGGYSSQPSTSPITSNASLPTPNYSSSNNQRYHPAQPQRSFYHPQSRSPTSTSLPLPFTSSSNHHITHNEYDASTHESNLLPQLNEDRLSALSNVPPMIRGSWSLPRVSAVDLPPVEKEEQKKKLYQDTDKESTDHRVRIARYAARQASYAAKQAEYEAQRSSYEHSKMEYAIRLAEIELDKEALSIKKLELELELLRSRENRV